MRRSCFNCVRIYAYSLAIAADCVPLSRRIRVLRRPAYLRAKRGAAMTNPCSCSMRARCLVFLASSHVFARAMRIHE